MTRPGSAPSVYAEAVQREILRMADAARGLEPATIVPSCPDWTVAQLVEHTGTVHRWAGEMLRTGARERLDTGTLDLGLPADPKAYPDWLAAGAAPLVAAFAESDPDAPMWAWGADEHARFWPRRMLHETTIHRVDVELARGVRRPGIDAPIAADAIDELFDNLPCAAYFRPRVVELRGDGETIALRGTDGSDQWLIRLEPDGFRVERSDDHAVDDATVAVSAATDALALLLYGRRSLDDDGIAATGDVRVLTRWLQASAL